MRNLTDRMIPIVIFCGLLVAITAPLRAQDKEEEMKALLEDLIRDANKEMAAMNQLASATVDIDKQLSGMQELKRLKADLEKVRKARKDIFAEYEVALAGLQQAQMEIAGAAERIQLARTDADVEKAVALAKEHVARMKAKLEVIAREGKELKELKTAMRRDVSNLSTDLDVIKKEFAREIAGSPEIAKQLEALRVEIMALEVTLKRAENLTAAKEIVKAIGYTYEKIEILKTALTRLRTGKTKKPLASMKRELDKVERKAQEAAGDGDDDFFLTAPLESIKLIFSKNRIAGLYLNSINYYFTGNLGRMNLVYVIILGLLICVAGFSLVRLVIKK